MSSSLPPAAGSASAAALGDAVLVQLARHLRGAGWQNLSVARGQSQAFNAAIFGQAAPAANPAAASAV